MSDQLSVAVLTASWSMPAWIVRALERLVAETDATVTLVVTDERDTGRGPVETLRRAVELREWAVVAGVLDLVDGVRGPAPETRRRPLTDVPGVAEADHLGCVPETVDGWKNALPPRAVDRLAETDVAVRFGFGFLVGDALDAPEHGVLGFHHGDLREYRGQPMGFWEFVHGRAEAGVTLQRLNETLDGGEIVCLKRIPIDAADSWAQVKRRLFAASDDMLATGVDRLAADEPLDEPDELGDLYSHPQGRTVLTYLGKTATGLLGT